MLVKIGDGLFDPGEVVSVYPAGSCTSHLVLRNGTECPVRGAFDDVTEDLIDAGLFPDPDVSTLPQLSPEEAEELRHLYALGFTYIARDKDGKLYAYSDLPKKSGAYWTGTDIGDQKRMTGAFDFVDSEAEEPVLISSLL